MERKGWFTDTEIYTMDLPDIRVGKNTLIVKTPISKRISLENMFLLGDFGVRVEGCETCITERKDTIAFGSIAEQGLPFYGAAITYELPVKTEALSDLRVTASLYAGAVIGVKLDGCSIENVEAGEHTISLVLYPSRVNTFGVHHMCVDPLWKGPNIYYGIGTTWSYEYNLQKVGILKSPIIEVFEK